jgi:hypothetical protein
VPILFILGSPRTGSTLIYQVVINFFRTFYFSNFIAEHFADHPAVGAALDETLNPHKPVSYESALGKTNGLWEPSEASLIFRSWFGGEHPSQTESCAVLAGREQHLLASMESISGLAGRMIVTKNAWNCFRIKALATLFPRAHFLWIRRDIGLSALSDLKSRYLKGSPTIWNSATTANYQEIQKRPYWEQVVEQQYEYNCSIEADLKLYSRSQCIEMWYEELCMDLEPQLGRLQRYFAMQNESVQFIDNRLPALSRSSGKSESDEDYARIRQYIVQHEERFRDHVYETNRSLFKPGPLP